MIDFDFHNLLFPSEFEKFCRDILEIREPNIKFTTYRAGRDGGIDIKSTNTELKIIGQCKLYHPQGYNSLIGSLKKEVVKCKRQKPDRYIICTNIELSPSQAQEIKNLFSHYILYEEDIIDGIKLNKYLGQKEYEYLFKSYSKLLVPNLSLIELTLEKVINKKYYNNTKTFFDDINAKHKLFHNTRQLPQLIKQLEDNRIIILSGNPGVGKTTTAMMIANYFSIRKRCSVLYLEERDYHETLGLAEENRLIIVDDFWGQNFSPSIQYHSTFQREIQSITKHFIQSSNSYLILVSRDYVIKDVLANAEYETETLFDQNKYVINLEEFTPEDKLRIFVNHLLFYDYDLSYIEYIKYADNFERILSHENYSPRHLDFFLKTYIHKEHGNRYDFYKSLNSYLDSPIAFWKETITILNPTSKIILLILLATGDSMSFDDLKMSFDSIQIEARNLLNVNINPLDFQKELIKLEEFYITVKEDGYYDSIIGFQSPGIKDYLLEYLRTDGSLWIQPIISRSLFFNQLTFIFSTDDEEIIDYDSDIPLYGKKIKLKNNLKSFLKNKLLTDFDVLCFSNHEERDFSDQLTRYDSAEDIKYLKLKQLNDLYNIELSENTDVKDFIAKQVMFDFGKYDQEQKIVSHRSMMYFPNVIKFIYPYLNLSANAIINAYYNSITFASEYDYLYEFNDIFQLQFQDFYNRNINAIKKHIKSLVFDNIDHYLWEDDGKVGMELDVLLHVTIQELSKKYKIRITKKLVNELEMTFDRSFSFLLKGKKAVKHRLVKNKTIKHRYTPKSYQTLVDEYLPIVDDYDPIAHLKENKYFKLIKLLKDEKSILSKFINDKLAFEDIALFLVQNSSENYSDLYSLLDSHFNDHSIKIEADPKLLAFFYYQILNVLEYSGDHSITRSKLNILIFNSAIPSLKIEQLCPIIVPYGNWYKFGNTLFQEHLKAKYLYSITDNHQYREEIIDACHSPYDNQILEFLQSIDKRRLYDNFIIPEVNKFINAIDFTNQRSIAISYVSLFGIECDLSWNKKEKTLECFSSSCAHTHYENILSLCGGEFHIDDLEVFFMEDIHEDTIKRLNINTEISNELSRLVIKTMQSKPGRYLILNEPVRLFEIKFSNFLQLDENYQIAEKVGMINYILQTVEKIKCLLHDYNDLGGANN